MEHSKKPIDSAIAGSIAGFVARVVVSPLDVVKIRWQLSSHSNLSFLNTFRHVIRAHGWAGLFRGNLWGLALWVGYGAVQFPAYETCKNLTGESGGGHIVAGALAASLATAATFPLDALRTRRISSHSHHFQNIFRGLGPGLLSIAPMSGLTFALHEYFVGFGFDKGVSGTMSGIIARMVVFPLDTVKRRMMAQGLEHVEHGNVIKHYNSAWDCAKTVLREEGALAFFRGISPSLVKTGVGSGITFFVYDRVLHKLNLGRTGRTEVDAAATSNASS
jgi:solute carrier family 25 thiamine pyrophosphate transporter 19